MDLEYLEKFRGFRLEPGYYRVVWRVQFFSVREQKGDMEVIYDRTCQLYKEHPYVERSEYLPRFRNPMRFPVWPESDGPSFPHRPTLKFSAGYGASPRKVRDYQLVYGLGQRQIADQVLLPALDSIPRLDHLVTASDYWSHIDSGWIGIESSELFEIVEGRLPVFVVSNIDTGDWQGGFRFGGLDLHKVRSPMS